MPRHACRCCRYYAYACRRRLQYFSLDFLPMLRLSDALMRISHADARAAIIFATLDTLFRHSLSLIFSAPLRRY